MRDSPEKRAACARRFGVFEHNVTRRNVPGLQALPAQDGPTRMPSLILDSVTVLSDARGRAALAASHGGVYAAYYAAKAGIKAVILCDAGVGRERAGIAGLDYLAALLGSDVKQIVPALGQWEFLQWQDVSGDHLGDELMVGRVDGDNLSFRGCHDKPGSGYEIQAGGQLEPGDEKDRRAGAGQARPGNRRLGRDDVPAARRSDL